MRLDYRKQFNTEILYSLANLFIASVGELGEDVEEEVVEGRTVL